jgi:2-haloacid dehalogenase
VPGELRTLQERGWRIAILSNTDPDLLEASLETIGVPAYARITAKDAGSYNPAQAHGQTLFERDDVNKERHVHVAASAFHDIAPAAQLGVPAVWINRLGETSDLPRAGELKTLSSLADLLDRIRPA